MHEINGVLVQQNEQDFIIGKMSIKEVLEFTKYTERVITLWSDNGEPIYNDEIQRNLEKGRVNKISDFLINDPEAVFPTNIILGIPLEAIDEMDNRNGRVRIKLANKVFEEVKKEKEKEKTGDLYVSIIDGQHRMRGIEVAISELNKLISNEPGNTEYRYKKELLLNIELVLSFFIGKSLEYQAMIFSTINRTQKRVSQDLVYSLFGLSTAASPYKTALEIVLALNGHKQSPFYQRVKLYGGKYRRTEIPPLSQSMVVKSIVKYISETDREAENDRFRARKELLKRPKHKDKYLPFRIFYAKNEDDKISDILFYYFNAVKKTFINRNKCLWDLAKGGRPNNILNSSVGFEALLQILVDILKESDLESNTIFKMEYYEEYLNKAQKLNLTDESQFPLTTKGKKIFFLEMHLAIFSTNEGYREKMKELDDLRSSM